MTYTREQKIARLQELLEGCRRGLNSRDLAKAWLSQPEGYTSRGNFLKSYVAQERQDEAAVTWDVHTGVAFTKLYRALK